MALLQVPRAWVADTHVCVEYGQTVWRRRTERGGGQVPAAGARRPLWARGAQERGVGGRRRATKSAAAAANDAVKAALDSSGGECGSFTSSSKTTQTQEGEC